MADPGQQATVQALRRLTPEVYELVLMPQRRIPFRPGQWVSLRLPIGERPPLVRAYSMAEPEHPEGRLTLAFDVVPGGRASTYLAGLQPGDRVELAGPYGNFVVPDPINIDIVFLARYTGIVPVRCILTQLLTRPFAHRIYLFYSAPVETERPYHDELTGLATARSELEYVPLPPEQPRVSTGAGRVQPGIAALRARLGDRRDYLPMISGIKAFVRPLRAYIQDLGFERKAVRVETYD